MQLTSIEIKPKFGLGWMKFLWLPSRKQTEKARQEVKKNECSCLAHPVVEAFADGRLTIGTNAMIDGRVLLLKGVYPKMEFPQAMVFWDSRKGCHIQLTVWGRPDDFIIMKE